MGTFSIWHWLTVLIIVALIFGTRKLRNLGSDLGGAVKDFKEGMRDPYGAPNEPTVSVSQQHLVNDNVDLSAQEKSRL